MLNRIEKSVMDVIYEKCADKGSCLISAEEIDAKLKHKTLGVKKINAILNSLSLDNYFELLPCKKNGADIFCVNLLTNGYSYKREARRRSREILNRIVFAVLTALVTFAVGKLLLYIFR